MAGRRAKGYGKLTPVKQGRNECALATLAALAERPLESVRQTARKITGCETWAEFIERCYPWTDMTKELYLLAGRELLDRVIPNRAANIDVARFFLGEYACGSAAPTAPALPAQGRGYVVLGWTGGSHILPWQDGYAHDTDGHAGETLEALLARYRARNDSAGWRVTRIDVVEQ